MPYTAEEKKEYFRNYYQNNKDKYKKKKNDEEVSKKKINDIKTRGRPKRKEVPSYKKIFGNYIITFNDED